MNHRTKWGNGGKKDREKEKNDEKKNRRKVGQEVRGKNGKNGNIERM